MYVQVGDFHVSRGPPIVQLMQILQNTVFFKSPNPLYEIRKKIFILEFATNASLVTEHVVC
jgi:hypothetical protein